MNEHIAEQMKATQNRVAFSNSIVASLLLIDLHRHCPVAGATVIEMSGTDESKGQFAGFSDPSGKVDMPVATPHLRILADGYAPTDICIQPDMDTLNVVMSPIMPAAYSGDIPGRQRAIWQPETSNATFFEFTADGLARRGRNFSDLMSAKYACYSLSQTNYWSGLSAPNAVSSEWSNLKTRNLAYPMSPNWDKEITGVNQFRFPEPMVMIARNSQRPNTEIRYQLLQ